MPCATVLETNPRLKIRIVSVITAIRPSSLRLARRASRKLNSRPDNGRLISLVEAEMPEMRKIELEVAFKICLSKNL